MMHQTLCILTMVDLSEGSRGIPEVKGVYTSRKAAQDNAVVLLCGKAAEWDIPESAVDTENLRVSDEREFKVLQLNISEVEMSIEPKIEIF